MSEVESKSVQRRLKHQLQSAIKERDELKAKLGQAVDIIKMHVSWWELKTGQAIHPRLFKEMRSMSEAKVFLNSIEVCSE